MSGVLSLSRCPHCSIAKPLLTQNYVVQTEGGNGECRVWAGYVCSNCGGIVTAVGWDKLPLDPNYPAAVFPSAKDADDLIPNPARTFLQQAMETLHAPDAAAVMAGSAVDAMLKNIGYVEGTLYQRIDRAKTDAKLTSGMADWAHSVRLGSNRPRHADLDSPHVSPADARRSVEFAEALGHFLFVLSAKIAAATAEVASND